MLSCFNYIIEFIKVRSQLERKRGYFHVLLWYVYF